jgi:hypothetical protein
MLVSAAIVVSVELGAAAAALSFIRQELREHHKRYSHQVIRNRCPVCGGRLEDMGGRLVCEHHHNWSVYDVPGDGSCYFSITKKGMLT